MANNEHTVPEPLAARVPRLLRERKVKPDGSVQEFALEFLGRTGGVEAGRYRLPPRPTRSPKVPFPLPASACSDGYFFRNRPYSVYRFRAPGGAVLGHRIDAVADVELTPDSVTYRDLALDWWVLSDGRVTEEDGDEFEALVAAAVFSPGDAVAALAARRAVQEDWDAIEAELARLEATWAPRT